MAKERKNRNGNKSKNKGGKEEKKKKKKGNNYSDKLNWRELYLSIKEVRKSIEALGERQKETDERIKKMQERTEKMIQDLAERQEEDRKQFEEYKKESRKQLEESRRQIEEFRNQVARITDSWGRFVEGMVEPAAISYFRKRGLVPYQAHPRLKVSRNGRNAEYDLLLVAPEHKTAMLVSAKTHVSSRDINELEDDIKSLGFFMPELKGYKVRGAIAGITFGKGADKFAFRKGFIILKVSEDNFEIIEPKKTKVFKL